MGNQASEDNITLTIRKGKYKYWLASVYIMRKRYTKTFQYNDEGHVEAEKWIKNNLRELHK